MILLQEPLSGLNEIFREDYGDQKQERLRILAEGESWHLFTLKKPNALKVYSLYFRDHIDLFWHISIEVKNLSPIAVRMNSLHTQQFIWRSAWIYENTMYQVF